MTRMMKQFTERRRARRKTRDRPRQRTKTRKTPEAQPRSLPEKTKPQMTNFSSGTTIYNNPNLHRQNPRRETSVW